MRSKKLIGAAIVVIATAAGGAIALASTGGAALSAAPSAATNAVSDAAASVTSDIPNVLPAAATSDAPASSSAVPARPSGPHTVGSCTETPLTGDDKTKAEAAANKAVPNATIDRTETDCDGAKYEVHMTKSDGSHVTVKEDASFKVTGVEDGMGSGAPGGPHGGPGSGPRPGNGAGTPPQSSAQPTT